PPPRARASAPSLPPARPLLRALRRVGETMFPPRAPFFLESSPRPRRSRIPFRGTSRFPPAPSTAAMERFSRSTRRELARALHRCLNRVEERGAGAGLFGFTDGSDGGAGGWRAALA